MLKTIYLIHHSHTDIGYTHAQPTVRYLQQRFLDEAIALTDRTRQTHPDSAQARWTCEVLLPVIDWLENASPSQIKLFRELEQQGYIEVTACYAVMCQTAPLPAWEFMLGKMEQLRSRYGLTIRSAMQSDIDGMPWSLPDLLATHGIQNFSMAINEHFGKSALPRLYPFIWRGPDNHTVRAWNGLHYNANQYFGIPENIKQALNGIGEIESWLKSQGYNRDFIFFQVTRSDFVDNNGVDPGLPDFVKKWNELGHAVRMEIVTLTGFFEAIATRAFAEAPVYSGEWTDFWNFGATSTPAETALNRRTYHRLLSTRPVRQGLPEPMQSHLQGIEDDILEKAILYDEHTWGADCSVSAPFSTFGRSGLNQKQGFAYHAEAMTSVVAATALGALADSLKLPKQGQNLLVINPLPWARTQVVEVPVQFLRHNVCPTLSHRHRMQIPPVTRHLRYVSAPVNEPAKYANAENVRFNVTVGAESYLTLPADEVYQTGEPSRAVSRELESAQAMIENKHFRVRLHDRRDCLDHFESRWAGMDRRQPADAGGCSRSPDPVDRPTNRIPSLTQLVKVHGVWGLEYNLESSGGFLCGSGGLPGHLCARRILIQQPLVSPFASRASLEVVLDDALAHVELGVVVDYLWDERPCAWYLPLELALTNPVFDYESAGSKIRLGRDQIPNSCMDYQTVHRWIAISGSDGAAAVIPLDTPLVSLGGFMFGRMTDTTTPRRPMIAAWLQSNYWDTNYAASCIGKVEYRFVIKPFASVPDAEGLDRLSDECTNPLLIQPIFPGRCREPGRYVTR